MAVGWETFSKKSAQISCLVVFHDRGEVYGRIGARRRVCTYCCYKEMTETSVEVPPPTCIRRLASNLSIAIHIPCVLQHFASNRCLLVHTNRDFDDLIDPPAVNLVCLTVIDLPKTRFPCFKLNQIHQTCQNIQRWIEQTTTGHVLFYSKGVAKSLLIAAAYQLWINGSRECASVFDDFKSSMDDFGSLPCRLETHPIHDMHLSGLFASQRKFLQFWRNQYCIQCRTELKPDLPKRTLRILGLELQCVFSNTALMPPEQWPVFEIWFEDDVVFSTNPTESESWVKQSAKLLDVNLHPILTLDSRRIWTLDIGKCNFLTDDCMIRVLPQRSGDCLLKFSSTQWMLRTQLHIGMLTMNPISRKKIRFHDNELDGVDLLPTNTFSYVALTMNYASS